RVVDEAQERDEIADVRLFEEADAAGDLIRDLQARELELDIERLEMRAVEDRDVAERAALVDEAADALHDKLRLLASVHGLDEIRLLRIGARGAEFLLEAAAFRLREQNAVGEGEDLGR